MKQFFMEVQKTLGGLFEQNLPLVLSPMARVACFQIFAFLQHIKRSLLTTTVERIFLFSSSSSFASKVKKKERKEGICFFQPSPPPPTDNLQFFSQKILITF